MDDGGEWGKEAQRRHHHSMKNRILLETAICQDSLNRASREPGQPNAGQCLLRQRTGRTQTEGNHKTRDHRTKTTPQQKEIAGLNLYFKTDEPDTF
jgi:hypothetical protein